MPWSRCWLNFTDKSEQSIQRCATLLTTTPWWRRLSVQPRVQAERDCFTPLGAR